MSERLEIRTLGGLAVERDGQPVSGFVSRTAEALLIYLAYTRQSYPREVLAEFLWPYRERETALGNLRTVLASLRKRVGPYVLTGDPVSMNPAGDCWLDAAELEARLAQAGEQPPAFLKETLDLYRGEFLQGVYVDSAAFDAWASLERERLRLAAMGGLDRLITAYASQGDYRQGITAATRLLQMDRVREQTHRQLMRLLALSGQRGKALEQYEVCRQALAEEHGVEPEPATTELYEQIRAGKPLEAPAAVKPIRGYELREQIGAGAFGAVYRAYQPVVGREVAIKVIKPEYADQPDFIRRFETEARLVARLEHINIVPLYDYWREPGGAYLVMRWLPGGLRDRLQRGPLTLSETTRLVEQIAAALAVAHRSGVIHRDLKPANILLDDEGNAYLADFGIAKALVQTSETTQEGQIVGSPGYLSPERIKGEPVSPSADLYSLGVVIYEALTGQHPFPGDLTPSALLYKQLSEPLPSVRDAHPELPAALDAVIQRATAKDPADRYPDALSLAAAFREAAGAVAPVPGEEKVLPLERAAVEGERTWTPADDLVALRNPYKGLHAFEEADAADFFGREALVEQLLARLAQDDPLARFLAVVGPSGCGKSSVVKAGLIPALRRGALPGSEWWYVAEMLPGAHPMEEVELALTRLAAVPGLNLLPVLRENERGLLRAVRQVLPEKSSQLLLVVDQFEEVFTLVEDPAEAAHFLDSLYAAITAPRSPLRVILTLRADFTDRPLLYAEFGELLRQRIEFVLPLTAEELDQAITGPAQQVGVQLDPTLLAAIVADVHDEPGILPLLEYALTEVFERRDDHRLTLASYQAVGGVLGALARRAEAVYTRQTPEQQALARQVFLRLVTLGEGAEDTRRRVRQSELVAVAPDSVLLQTVLDAFTRARLLTRDRDALTREPTVEVAHEALLRQWLRLRAWLEESRADVREQRVLSAAADDWQQAGCERSFLFTGSRLAQFEDWAARTDITLTLDERAFLDASLVERRTQQTRRRLVRNIAFGITAAVALIMAVLALVAFEQRSTARLQRDKAEREAAVNRSLALAATAEDQFKAGNVDLALALALEAVKIDSPPSEARLALSTVALGPGTRAVLRQSGSEVKTVAFSPDSRWALSGGCAELSGDVCNQGELILWDLANATELRHLEGHTGWVNSVAFNPAPATGPITPLSASGDGTLILWNVATGEIIRRFEGHTGGVNTVAFDSTGQRAVSGSVDGTLILWNVATGEIVRRFEGHTAPVNCVAFSPDGSVIASGSDDKTIILWNVETGKTLRQLKGPDAAVLTLAFRTDAQGHITLFSGSSNLMREWDIDTGEQVRYKGVPSLPIALEMTPDGRSFVSCEGNACELYDLEQLSQTYILYSASALVSSGALSPDGRLFLMGFQSGALIMMNMPVSSEIRRFEAEGGLMSLDVSPDGRYLLTGSFSGGTVILWDLQTGQPIRRLDGLEDAVTFAGFSPDGKQALIGSADAWRGTPTSRLVLWDVATGQIIHELKGFEFYPRSYAFSPDGHIALVGTLQWGSAWKDQLDGELILYDLETGVDIRHYEPIEAVMGIAFSRDGRFALTGNDLNGITYWDVETGQLVRSFDYTGYGIIRIPGGDSFLAGSIDSSIMLDPQTGEILRRFVGPEAISFTFDFGPDGSTFLSGSGGGTGTFALWNLHTGAKLRLFTAYPSGAGLWNLVYSPDGQTVFSSAGGPGEAVIEWQIADWPLDKLLTWVHENRYVRDFTCEERAQYHVEPLCKGGEPQ